MRNRHIDLCTLALIGGALLCGQASAQTQPFTLCAGWPTTFKLTSLTLDPNPPSVKQAFVEAWTFQNSTAIATGARIKEVWKLGSSPLQSFTVDLCDELSKSGLACPLPAGARAMTKVTYPSANTPPFVTVSIRRELYNGDGSKLACYNMNVKFKP